MVDKPAILVDDGLSLVVLAGQSPFKDKPSKLQCRQLVHFTAIGPSSISLQGCSPEIWKAKVIHT